MSGAQFPEMTDREAEMWRLRSVNRWTMQKIGDHFGLSSQRVSVILADVREKMPPIDVAGVRQQALDFYDDMQRRLMELVELNGAPVTAGKDGEVVYDPESGAAVRDFSGRINALRAALDADKERRKLLGADAATKVESTATVRYEIAGVDPEALA